MSIDASELPREFGPYLLKQKLASGGMAELYLAEAKGPGGFIKPLVIKMIHPAYNEDERFLSMFTEEAKIVSNLNHGNIVPIFDFGHKEGLWYLAMEFIDGVDVATLADVCRLYGISLPLEIALFIGMGTAAALSHAHESRDTNGKPIELVHRDVSPQNILVSRSGEVKLCDFGLAAQAVSTEEVNDEIKGKLRYLSPEQTRGEPVDRRSDLFSLGVVLYELIAGHHPVAMGTDVTVLQTLSGEAGFPSLSECAPWIPEAVTALVDRAVAFDPENRFSSAEEMRARLSKILHRDFPDFTPQLLAELVEEVQGFSAELNGEDADSVIRSRLATFASKSRAKVPLTSIGPTTRRRPRSRPAPIIALLVVLLMAAIVAAVLGLGPLNRDARVPPKRSTPTPPTPVAVKAVPSPLPDSTAANPDTESDVGADAKDAASSKASNGIRKPAPVKKPKGVGTVNINAAPWADVSIDGVDYTTTPILGLKLSEGKHKATFVNPELGVTKTRTFEVKKDETVRLLVEME